MGNPSVEQRQWLAGFFEGDSTLKAVGGYPLVSFNEAENQPMHEFIRDSFQLGSLGPGHLNVTGADLTRLLSVVADYLVSPNRVDKLNEYYSFGVVHRSFSYHLPSLDWLVGMWDANGSSSWDGTYLSKISVSSKDTHMLSLIRSSFGGGVYTSNGNAVPVWHLTPTELERGNFLEVASYIVEASKNEPRRGKLEERLAAMEVKE